MRKRWPRDTNRQVRPVGEGGCSGRAAEGRGEVSISFRNVEGEAQVSG